MVQYGDVLAVRQPHLTEVTELRLLRYGVEGPVVYAKVLQKVLGEGSTEDRYVVADTTIRDGLPVTSGTRTALDVIAMTDEEHALVVVDGLLHNGETTLPLLERGAQTRVEADAVEDAAGVGFGGRQPRQRRAEERLGLRHAAGHEARGRGILDVQGLGTHAAFSSG